MQRFLIIAGEPSADAHAARLMRAMKSIKHGVEFHGIGGEAMIAEGLVALKHSHDVAVVGLVEVLKHYPMFHALMSTLQGLLRERFFDAFIPVDFPGFNLRLARHAHRIGVPVFYFIAPQVWAWGKSRVHKLAEYCTRVMSVFRFEHEYLNRYGVRSVFVGHPLLDDPIFDPRRPESERSNSVVVLPGSRRGELIRHAPIVAGTIDALKAMIPDARIIVSRFPEVPEEAFSGLAGLDCELSTVPSRELMRTARVGLIKSGTSTLEAALLGLPITVMYRVNNLTYQIAKHLVDLQWLSLPNILTRQQVVTEFVQHNAQPQQIAAEIMRLWNAFDGRSARSLYAPLWDELGEPGAAMRAAQTILEGLD